LRRDHRSVEQFKKDIKFYTQIEQFWFKIFLDQLRKEVKLVSFNDHGVDNTGAYCKKANGNADYSIIYDINGKKYNMLVEIKWCPTNKATFKVNNLKSYIKQEASIVLFYNISDLNFKTKEYDVEKHTKLLSDNLDKFKWGLIHPDKMELMLQEPIEYPYWMGSKPSVIFKDKEIEKYLNPRDIL